VAIGSGWISYLTPDGKLVPVVNCNPPPELGQTCEPQGSRWHDGKLYLTSRHRGILVYDPQTKQLTTLVYTYRNQLFKGPNDLDFDAEGNLFFTDPWGTGPHGRRLPVFARRRFAQSDGQQHVSQRDRGLAR
jgi:gluconolactonase